jgi:hypothetical protein
VSSVPVTRLLAGIRRAREEESFRLRQEPAAPIGDDMKRVAYITDIALALFFMPSVRWLEPVLARATVLVAGTTLTTATGFFVVRWLKSSFPESPSVDPASSDPTERKMNYGRRGNPARWSKLRMGTSDAVASHESRTSWPSCRGKTS